MQLLFYKGAGSLVDALIRFWTWGPYSHVEVRFRDGMCFTASPRYGTIMRRLEPYGDVWDLCHVESSYSDEQDVRGWCRTQLHKPYDYLGLFGLSLRHKRLQDPERWYCSEICGEVLRRVGCESLPEQLSPNAMAREISKRPETFRWLNKR